MVLCHFWRHLEALGRLKNFLFFANTKPKKLHCGKDAIVTVLTKYLHLKKLVADKFINRTTTDKLEGCRITKREEKKVTRQNQLVVFLTHKLFPQGDIYCVKRFAKVTKEGPSDFFYDGVATEVANDAEGGAPDEVQLNQVEILVKTPAICFQKFRSDNPELAAAQEEGIIEVDDDNLPVEENIPTDETSLDGIYEAEWGHDNICQHMKARAG